VGREGIVLRHDSVDSPLAAGFIQRKQRSITSEALDGALKRVLDVVVSTTLLVLLAPIVLILAIAIKLESRGPVFYRCLRVGQNGTDLLMLKFRKMHDGAGGPALAAAEDERFTRLGPFLAKTKLDEIPQLWNVLCGEMSLVGPRPEDPTFIGLHSEAYTEILKVRPGITGYCQLAFARENQILDPSGREKHYVERILPQKVGMDRLYASRRSVLVDLRILWWTVYAVLLSREVAVHRETGALNARTPRSSLGTVAVEKSSG
jgi:lipopolysaccharide/colanic/teichoic acid biosynthesis glycosyltransferase